MNTGKSSYGHGVLIQRWQNLDKPQHLLCHLKVVHKMLHEEFLKKKLINIML